MKDWDVWARGQTSPRIADEVLHLRIAESVAWCESLASLADCRPSRFPQNLLHDGPDDLVCSIGRDRQSAARRRKLATTSEEPVVVPGRLMLHFPDENLTDGAAEVGSEGFFDVWNLPPFLRWIATPLLAAPSALLRAELGSRPRRHGHRLQPRGMHRLAGSVRRCDQGACRGAHAARVNAVARRQRLPRLLRDAPSSEHGQVRPVARRVRANRVGRRGQRC